MKLILCTNCQDVVRLMPEEERFCKCGMCSGKYDDEGIYAWYTGKYCVPIGFDNESFLKAIQRQPEDGKGYRFEAFVIPMDSETFQKR